MRDKVWELHNKGWGYTKIHRYLLENNFEVGKHRTCVHTMIKKRKKREEILNQPVLEDGFKDFRLEVYSN